MKRHKVIFFVFTFLAFHNCTWANSCLFRLKNYIRVHKLHSTLPSDVKVAFIKIEETLNLDGVVNEAPFNDSFLLENAAVSNFLNSVENQGEGYPAQKSINIGEVLRAKMRDQLRIRFLHLLYQNSARPEVRAHASFQLLQVILEIRKAEPIISHVLTTAGFDNVKILDDDHLKLVREVFPGLSWPIELEATAKIKVEDLAYTTILTDLLEGMNNNVIPRLKSNDLTPAETHLIFNVFQHIFFYEIIRNNFPQLENAVFQSNVKQFNLTIEKLKNSEGQNAKRLYWIIKTVENPDNALARTKILELSEMLVYLKTMFSENKTKKTMGDVSDFRKIFGYLDGLQNISRAESVGALEYLVRNKHMNAALGLLSYAKDLAMDDSISTDTLKPLMIYAYAQLEFYASNGKHPDTYHTREIEISTILNLLASRSPEWEDFLEPFAKKILGSNTKADPILIEAIKQEISIFDEP